MYAGKMTRFVSDGNTTETPNLSVLPVFYDSSANIFHNYKTGQSGGKKTNSKRTRVQECVDFKILLRSIETGNGHKLLPHNVVQQTKQIAY